MTWRSARLALAGVTLLAWPASVRSAGAQQVKELGIQATVLASDPAVVLGGAYGAVRLSSRTRLALTGAAGATDGRFAWRAELLGHFLLNPRATRRAAWYGGGGAAISGAGGNERAFVVLLMGLESNPGGRSGWMVEAGLGGGFRAAAGWRWRRK